jgi:DNA-binding CsgD family transcriptional regulator
MKPDGTAARGSPFAEFLRAQVERISARFQAATGSPGSVPDRAALHRFLVALDELSAATDGLGRDTKTAPSASATIFVAADDAFAEEVRRAVEPHHDVVVLPADDAALSDALERRPDLLVGVGAAGAAGIRRVHALRPGVPALLAAQDGELAEFVETFASDPVVLLRAPGGKELALAIRTMVAAAARGPQAAVEPQAPVPRTAEPRSYAHLAGMLPRALERTVQFDVGVAVIARPGADPLVDVYAASECSDTTRDLVRDHALTLFGIVSGGTHKPEDRIFADSSSPVRSSVYFPLATEGGVVGLTYLASFRPSAFSHQDELVLAALAKHASGAYRRLEASVHRLRLSPRQSQVLALIASGLSDKEVAERLGLAHRTVRTHVDRMLREHGLRSRTEAVAAWLRGQQG